MVIRARHIFTVAVLMAVGFGGYFVAMRNTPAFSATPMVLYKQITTKQAALSVTYQAKQAEMRQLENQFNLLEGQKQMLLKQNPGLDKQVAAEIAATKPNTANK
jgi:EamA domain-containing membrane protein RarD